MVALDDLMAGRVIEVADVLASRLRQLSLGIKTVNWESSQNVVVYRGREPALIVSNTLDVAHTAKRQKRAQKALAVNKASR